MRIGRLLLPVLFLGSLPAFTQDQPVKRSNQEQTPAVHNPATTQSTEPSRIIPKANGGQSLVLGINPDITRKAIVVSPDGPLVAEMTCYSIRSYVVARDSKKSDSTHPVSYSTCQPANRYRLKTADAQADLSGH